MSQSNKRPRRLREIAQNFQNSFVREKSPLFIKVWICTEIGWGTLPRFFEGTAHGWNVIGYLSDVGKAQDTQEASYFWRETPQPPPSHIHTSITSIFGEDPTLTRSAFLDAIAGAIFLHHSDWVLNLNHDIEAGWKCCIFSRRRAGMSLLCGGSLVSYRLFVPPSLCLIRLQCYEASNHNPWSGVLSL